MMFSNNVTYAVFRRCCLCFAPPSSSSSSYIFIFEWFVRVRTPTTNELYRPMDRFIGLWPKPDGWMNGWITHKGVHSCSINRSIVSSKFTTESIAQSTRPVKHISHALTLHTHWKGEGVDNSWWTKLSTPNISSRPNHVLICCIKYKNEHKQTIIWKNRTENGKQKAIMIWHATFGGTFQTRPIL